MLEREPSRLQSRRFHRVSLNMQVAVIATLRKLVQRWHRASSEVYVSEV